MEKKLTDEEIVKAFEHCNKSLPHDKCLLAEQHKEDWVTCQSKCGRMIIDLIHRLQDENKRLTEEKAELQKQVDELEDICLDCPYKLKFDEIEKQAVKDTAKEICLKIIKDQPQPIKEKWVEWFKKEYGVEVE